MLHITNEMVSAAIGFDDTQEILRQSFKSFGEGRADMQERIRTEAGGVKLSTLGAVIPDQEVLGAKVYSTINGQFTFVIVLFSAVDGRALATFEAAAITELRTAACSVIAAQHLARNNARHMVLFGAGVQGRAHILQMAKAFKLEKITIVRFAETDEVLQELSAEAGVNVCFGTAEEAIPQADIIVTASRSPTPLFSGELIAKGTFIAAVGSSLPYTRELDDTALAKTDILAIEWRQQSFREAGDLVMAAPGVITDDKVIELGELLSGRKPGRVNDDQITLYKAVGVGLQDIAIAGLAYSRIAQG